MLTSRSKDLVEKHVVDGFAGFLSAVGYHDPFAGSEPICFHDNWDVMFLDVLLRQICVPESLVGCSRYAVSLTQILRCFLSVHSHIFPLIREVSRK